jgi:hypothetical protein
LLLGVGLGWGGGGGGVYMIFFFSSSFYLRVTVCNPIGELNNLHLLHPSPDSPEVALC